MTNRHYYYVTSLPSLGQLGASAPLSPAALLEHVSPCDAREPVAMVLLSDDLLQRDGFIAGETQDVLPAVLTADQVRGEKPLPEYLFAESSGTSVPRVVAEATWTAYFRHASDVARQHDCGFLKDWVSFEVALRNAIAESRAAALGLEPREYTAATELASGDEDFTGLLGEWSRAPNPLAGLRLLDTARWKWMEENDNWYSFTSDELAAYAAKLVLLHRWQRLTPAEKPTGESKTGQAGDTATKKEAK